MMEGTTMKTNCKFFLAALLIAATTLSAHAQQVTTLYFLENAPMRHTINPAFQPVSNGYFNLTPLGYTSISLGNNSFTLSDLIFNAVDANGKFVTDANGNKIAVTPFHPQYGNKQAFLNQLNDMTNVNGEITLGLINFGYRTRSGKGYVTLGINERLVYDVTAPKSFFEVLADGFEIDNKGAYNYAIEGLGVGTSLFTEIYGGYSRQIDEQWTVGFKARLLLGHLRAGLLSTNINADGDPQKGLHIQSDVEMELAGPLKHELLPSEGGKTLNQFITELQNGTVKPQDLIYMNDMGKLLTPSGYGATFDIGMTYKPAKFVQISAAFNDLGFLYWTNSQRISMSVDTTMTGVGVIDVSDPAYRDKDGKFSMAVVMDTMMNSTFGLLSAAKMNHVANSYLRLATMKMNIGVDFNFWENRVGLGVVSATRLYNSNLYEEVTFGFAFRPVNWFNIAASYSLMNNGKYSNIGAGLSIMPYDGINLTVAMDYIPTSYANMPNKPNTYIIPDKTKMFNVAVGLSFCWGTNRPDKDHDGVWNKLDMCPDTPRGVQVDEHGCPLDEDGDGVPDYLDMCLGTPEASKTLVDANGCELDSDGDGVPDYLDKCPDTPEAAWGKVDENGCPLDSDGDGVPDYLDQCPDTPEEAKATVDANGCPKDSDGDGVPDYLDECPNTAEAARASVDQRGCPLDSDGDGVPDYIDECPDTPIEAAGKVDEKGCVKDSDGDGVPDYLDECPYVIGVPENKGCPQVKREVRQLLNKAMQGIQFEAGKATIKASSNQILDLIASIFIENSNYVVEVQGHTDNTGKYEQNMKISQQRANAVMNYLIDKGVPAERLSAVGYGSDVPVADNKTKAGRAKNRRVEFKISFEEVSYEDVLDRAETPAAPEAKTENAQ